MSDTPLTDSAEYHDGIFKAVPPSKCRELERRLNATTALLEKLRYHFVSSTISDEIETAIAAARKPL